MASISVEGPASAGAPAADHHLSDEKTQMLELLGITQELSSEVNAGKSIAEELDAYKREPALPLFDHNGNYSDPLPWWKQRALRYPRLHALALRTLQIQATSASSERAFSSAGLAITNERSSLLPRNASMLIFLRGAWDIADKFHGSKIKGHEEGKE